MQWSTTSHLISSSASSLLGLAAYYRRFAPQFSVVASLLYALSRKNASSCGIPYANKPSYWSTCMLIKPPNIGEEFLLQMDASGWASELCWPRSRRMGPCAHSLMLAKCCNLTKTTELEALGAVWAVKQFKPYLYSHRCHLYTDHEALLLLMNAPHPSGKGGPTRGRPVDPLLSRQGQFQCGCSIPFPTSQGSMHYSQE